MRTKHVFMGLFFLWGGASVPLIAAADGSALIYPNASLVESVDEQRQNHPVVASAMKKVNGVVKADKMEWLDGQLSRRLYRLPDGASSIEAYKTIRQNMETMGVKPLYQCEQFSCGDSNFWANNVFSIAQLYGLDREQAYFIGEKQESGRTVYYSVYTVRRGNQRMYALVDQFTREQADNNKQPIADQIKRFGYITLPANTEDEIKVILKAILYNHIREKPFTLTLSSENRSTMGAVDQQLVLIDRTLEKITQQLKAAGIANHQFRLLNGGIQPELSASGLQAVIAPLK